jgi:ribosomal protein S1
MKFRREYFPQQGNCFVIMPYGVKKRPDGREVKWDKIYEEVFAPAISDIGMTPIRADDIYGAQPLREHIWRGIQEAELVVADLTGRNPNVLYELGLADLIGKRIVLVTMDEQDFPSDIVDYHRITYTEESTGLVTFTRELQRNLRAAQSEPVREVELRPLPGVATEPIPATVIAVTSKFAIVEADDGRKAFLDSSDVSWERRIPDLTRIPKVKVGKKLNGAFVPGIRGDIRYSLIATEENPWPKLESEYPQGRRFTSEVKNHPAAVGVFVRMKYKINGLIPESQIPEYAVLDRGAEIEAEVTRIDPSRRRVELRFVRKIESEGGREQEWESGYHVGEQLDGIVSYISPQRDYMLVKLPNELTAMLHISNMSESFQSKFEQGDFPIGCSVAVEVAKVDKRGKKLMLSNID